MISAMIATCCMAKPQIQILSGLTTSAHLTGSGKGRQCPILEYRKAAICPIHPHGQPARGTWFLAPIEHKAV